MKRGREGGREGGREIRLNDRELRSPLYGLTFGPWYLITSSIRMVSLVLWLRPAPPTGRMDDISSRGSHIRSFW